LVRLRECHIFLLRSLKIEVIVPHALAAMLDCAPTTIARIAQVYFGLDGCVIRKFDLHLVGLKAIALMKQADRPAANNCSGLVPVPGTPGAENLTSKATRITAGDSAAPSEVRVLAAYRTVMPSCVEPATAMVF
jgi:hypothetical protein